MHIQTPNFSYSIPSQALPFVFPAYLLYLVSESRFEGWKLWFLTSYNTQHNQACRCYNNNSNNNKSVWKDSSSKGNILCHETVGSLVVSGQTFLHWPQACPDSFGGPMLWMRHLVLLPVPAFPHSPWLTPLMLIGCLCHAETVLLTWELRPAVISHSTVWI